MTASTTLSATPVSPPVHRLRLVPDGAGIVALLVMVWAIYGQTASFRFVNFDDDVHVWQNPHVVTGLTAENLRWSFEIHGPSQWHPLAWLSHQLDCEWYGIKAGGHHVTNVVLHALSAGLLFLACRRMLGSYWPALWIAAAFAVHPLNVESVAWISERRNVLAGVFWMLGLHAYLSYRWRPGMGTYLVVLATHGLALASKPLAVTLPCALLLLNIWPLPSQPGFTFWRRRVLEIVPMLVMSAVASWLTIECQRAVGTVASLNRIPLGMRGVNSVAAYGWYLQQTVWPHGLTAFYPHPALFDERPWDRLIVPAIVSAVVLLLLTAAVWRWRRTSPWLAVGWLWFLGTLLPMIGIMQVGEQQQADRYAYVSLIGLFLPAAMAGWKLSEQGREARGLVVVIAIASITGWGLVAWGQAAVWQDSKTLFSHATSINSRNPWAWNNLGHAWLEEGRPDVAVQMFQKATEAWPPYALAHYNLGVAWDDLWRPKQALAEFEMAVRLDPSHADARMRLGAALAQSGRVRQSLEHFDAAVRLRPQDWQARYNQGLALAAAGETDAAIAALKEACRIRPNDSQGRHALEALLRKAGKAP